MSYKDIVKEYDESTYLKRKRQAELYVSIWRDISAIIKIVIPNDKAHIVSSHCKSILYAIIELKTGVKVDKL